MSAPTLAPGEIDAARESLAAWFERAQRPLPWRATRDPWAVWVSEIMLQQTRADSVIPYWRRFLEAFPTPAALASRPVEDLLDLWAGLGYYARARHLHAAARRVVEVHAGRVPSSAADFAALPGVGRYTLGAVLSIAFDTPLPVLDGNVARVLSRLVALDADPKALSTQRALWSLAEQLVPSRGAGAHNQALMELGATVCTPRQPACLVCPWQTRCAARRLGLEATLPRAAARTAQTRHTLVAALCLEDSPEGPAVWLVRRPLEGLLGGLWELPCVEVPVDPGATSPDPLRALGLEPDADTPPRSIEHAFTHRRWTLHTWRARGVPPAHLGAEVARVPCAHLAQVALSGPALKALLAWGVEGAPRRRGAGRARREG